MLLVAVPLTFVDRPIGVHHLAVSLHTCVDKVAVVNVAIRIGHNAEAANYVAHKATIVARAIAPRVLSLAMLLIVLP